MEDFVPCFATKERPVLSGLELVVSFILKLLKMERIA